MSGLNTSLSIAVSSLQEDSTAIEVTNNNIANANTAGYSRQTVLLGESAPIEQDGALVGTGATLEGVQSIRDQLLTLRIQQQTQQQGSANAQASGLASIQPLFASSTSDLQSQLSSFFSSLSTLSAAPTSTADRQTVLSSAQNVATSFNTLSTGLSSEQTALSGQVTDDVGQINQLTTQIAAINAQLQDGGSASDAADTNGTLTDQRDQLVLQLSSLTNVSVTQTNDGETITTGNGTPLVLGDQSFALETGVGSNGQTDVLDSNGKDITSAISGGDLGGSLTLRDSTIGGLVTNLDTLASQFATAVNSAQAQGYDQNGNTGKALFSVPGTVAGSAAGIAVTTTDPAAIAASSDGSAGSNGNLANLSAVQTSALPAGQTPTDAYASLVYQVGNATSTANAESSAVASSLSQLNTQQSGVSGVSIDEETTNLIKYQQSYEAAARVISTVETLYTALDNIGTSA
jgi:flagellar hook-associated protein 1 FlgK